LAQQARQCDADIVLYGHTHHQKLEQVGNTFYLCPGSMGSAEQKYAIITMDEKGKIDISLRQL
jgi:putative phosphoesterase